MEWKNQLTWQKLLVPHASDKSRLRGHRYFEELLSSDPAAGQSFCVLDFVKKTVPDRTIPVHYGGLEDQKYYNDRILDAVRLDKWIRDVAADESIPSGFIIPETGDFFRLE